MSQQARFKYDCPECHDWGVLDDAQGIRRCLCEHGAAAAQEYIDCLMRLRVNRAPLRKVSPIRPLLNAITQADIDAALAARGKS